MMLKDRMKGRLLFLFLSFLILSGCSKPRFTIEFQLPESLHAAYTLSYYASSSRQGKWMESGVMVQAGKCKATLPTSNPTVVALSAGMNAIYFYVERGDKITVTGESADIFSWTIGGNAINDDWSQWRHENAAAVGSGD
ncbi:MAG: hypothetical protein K2H76_03980, partial [Muribaculaceae bacterium]|nr:hypothetical protein [Muribaculaceae bacterium]